MAPAESCELTVVVPRDVKEWLERQAADAGKPVQEFAASVLTEASHEMFVTEGTTVLSERDSKHFLEWLDKDHEPNEALRRLFEKHGRRNG